MKIAGSTIFVSGTNRGIGRAYVQQLLAAGARKIYAAARDTSKIDDLVKAGGGKVVPVKLDITDAAQVAAAAILASDTQILINNAGVNFNKPLVGIASLDNARTEIEVNYFGTLSMCRAFAPVLKANGGGAIVNMISILAKVVIPLMGGVCASKAAALNMTLAVRAELAKQGTHVMAVMPGAVDTDMTAGVEMPKEQPVDIAKAVIAGLEKGEEEVCPGGMAQGFLAGLKNDPKALEKELAQYLPQ